MGNGYKCPYCGLVTSQTESNVDVHDVYYKNRHTPLALHIRASQCADCGKVSFFMMGHCNDDEYVHYSYPPIDAKPFPDYVPLAIRKDYLEACSIADLSPKAAATLARRCLQGMIHDFWDIHEKNLNAEISSLRDKVTPLQWSAIDGLRKMGNIGAHMEKDIDCIVDVDPDEAQKLLTLIAFLIEKWYITRHDEEVLLHEIKEMAAQKEEDRHLTEAPSP